MKPLFILVVLATLLAGAPPIAAGETKGTWHYALHDLVADPWARVNARSTHQAKFDELKALHDSVPR